MCSYSSHKTPLKKPFPDARTPTARVCISFPTLAFRRALLSQALLCELPGFSVSLDPMLLSDGRQSDRSGSMSLPGLSPAESYLDLVQCQ